MSPSDLRTALMSRYARWRFNRVVRDVRRLPSLARGELPFILLSMVHTRDVESYMLAARSFARFLNPQRIVVVCDPSITDADRASMRACIPHIELRAATEFRHPELPVGGCWERLFAITEYARGSYVIQLDADTTALADMPEISDAIAGGVAFTHGERANQQTVSIAESVAFIEKFALREKPHVQALAEYALRKLTPDMPQRYVRGCAGFSGFPPDAKLRERLLSFAAQMKALLAERWSDWGTEQFASNYLIANYPRAQVLPLPRYCAAVQSDPTTVFIHFIGYCRFTNLSYSRHAQSILSGLARAAR